MSPRWSSRAFGVLFAAGSALGCIVLLDTLNSRFPKVFPFFLPLFFTAWLTLSVAVQRLAATATRGLFQERAAIPEGFFGLVLGRTRRLKRSGSGLVAGRRPLLRPESGGPLRLAHLAYATTEPRR